jgi:hypothetical protein
MLSKYFHAAARMREIRSSPAGKFIEGFAEALCVRGYAPITARRYIRSCVASATSGQNARRKMRDFELLRTPRRWSEVDDETRTSTIYGRAET